MRTIYVYLDRSYPLSISMCDIDGRCLGHFYRLEPPEGILCNMESLVFRLRIQNLEDSEIVIMDGLCIEQLLVNPHPIIRRVAKRYAEQNT
jgi:hypothetical protein